MLSFLWLNPPFFFPYRGRSSSDRRLPFRMYVALFFPPHTLRKNNGDSVIFLSLSSVPNRRRFPNPPPTRNKFRGEQEVAPKVSAPYFSPLNLLELALAGPAPPFLVAAKVPLNRKCGTTFPSSFILLPPSLPRRLFPPLSPFSPLAQQPSTSSRRTSPFPLFRPWDQVPLTPFLVGTAKKEIATRRPFLFPPFPPSMHQRATGT